MEKYNRGSFKPGRFVTPICDRQQTLDVSGDHVLPDYLPEIKRILRVGAKSDTPSTYMGGNPELSGNICYDLLYAAADGELYSARLEDPYRFDITLDKDADSSGDCELFCDLGIENPSARATGPRKLSLKCRLRPRVRCYTYLEPEERVEGVDDESDLRRLTEKGEYAGIIRGSREGIALADEVIPEGAIEDIRVIGAVGRVFVSEVAAGRDKMSCRGEVIIKLMVCRDGVGEGTLMIRKLPFSEECEVEGADVGNECRAWGELGEINVTVGEGRISCDTIMTLIYELQRPETFEYTRDIYSVKAPSKAVSAEYVVPLPLRCMNGNFTQNGIFDQKDNGIPSGSLIIDADGTAFCDKLTVERGKGVLSGEVRYNILFADEGEWGSRELTQPFRYEFDLPATVNEETDISYSANMMVVGCRGRLDGERVAVDSEISAAIRVFCNKSIECIGGVSVGESETRPRGECRICYPDSADTLWSVSKRYRADAERMATVNSIRVEGSPDSRDSLVGSRFLIVE